MPRTARASVGGICYHAMSRGNGHARVFHDERDYSVFVSLMRQACDRIPMRIAAWCLMPNHFHFVLWPIMDGDLGRWMHWLLTSHVRRHHKRYDTDGHIWQGRFKAPPIQQDRHLLSVLRYTECNPLRARLVGRPEGWRWSSLHHWGRTDPMLPLQSPIERAKTWLAWVNEPQSADELSAIRMSLKRSRPYGNKTWTKKTAKLLGLESSLHGPGPRKKQSKS